MTATIHVDRIRRMVRWRLDPGQIEVVDKEVAAILRSKTPAERVEMIGAAHRAARLMIAASVER